MEESDLEILQLQMESHGNAIRAQAKREGWLPEKAIEEEAKAQLPFFRALTDPHNMPRRSSEEIPKLSNILAEATAWFNKQYGVDYPPPSLTISAYTNGDGGFYNRGNDTVILSASIIKGMQENPDIARAIIAHELGHRYQRDDKTLLVDLEREITGHANTVEREVRNIETMSDFHAAQFASPQAVLRMLHFLADQRLVKEQFGKEYWPTRPDWPPPNQTPEQLQQWKASEEKAFESAVAALPPERRAAILRQGMLKEDTFVTNDDHPSVLARIELQTALQDHPELMKAKHITFDGNANIVDVEISGASYKSSQVQIMNKNADEKVGLRNTSRTIQ